MTTHAGSSPRAAVTQWVYNFVSVTSKFNTSNTPHYIQNNTSITSADPDRNNNMCIQIIEISLLFFCGCETWSVTFRVELGVRTLQVLYIHAM